MGLEDLLVLAREALQLSVMVSLPVVGVVALVGLFVSMLQAATQVQDQSVSQLSRLLTVFAVLLVAGSWMGQQLVQFTLKAFSGS